MAPRSAATLPALVLLTAWLQIGATARAERCEIRFPASLPGEAGELLPNEPLAGGRAEEENAGENGEAEPAPAPTSFWGRLRDPEDGRLDITANRPDASGFLPFLIPFNEPALGAGLVLGLAYFHPGTAPNPESVEEARFEVPSITFGAGAVSENGTWAAAVGHLGVWNDGRTR